MQLARNCRYSNRTGVDVRPRDFGGLGGVAAIDPLLADRTPYFQPLIDVLLEHGYEARFTGSCLAMAMACSCTRFLTGFDAIYPAALRLGIRAYIGPYVNLKWFRCLSGTQERKNLFGAPYDFRLAADGLVQVMRLPAIGSHISGAEPRGVCRHRTCCVWTPMRRASTTCNVHIWFPYVARLAFGAAHDCPRFLARWDIMPGCSGSSRAL